MRRARRTMKRVMANVVSAEGDHFDALRDWPETLCHPLGMTVCVCTASNDSCDYK